MVGPKPVRPLTAKTSFEKPAEGKILKKPKKPVVKSVKKSKNEAKSVSKTQAKKEVETPTKVSIENEQVNYSIYYELYFTIRHRRGWVKMSNFFEGFPKLIFFIL